jgi:hypothetical protein
MDEDGLIIDKGFAICKLLKDGELEVVSIHAEEPFDEWLENNPDWVKIKLGINTFPCSAMHWEGVYGRMGD